MKKNYFQAFAGFFGVLFMLGGCASQQTVDNGHSQEEISPVSCVVVLPARTPYSDGEKQLSTQGDLAAGLETLDGLVLAELRAAKISKVIEADQIPNVAGGGYSGAFGTLQEIAKNAQCPNVMTVNLSRFRQRKGTDMAADSPASAAFELRLVDTESRRSLCTANFSETQASLTENILAFGKAKRRGFKWITVEELVRQGVHEKMVECPYIYKAD